MSRILIAEHNSAVSNFLQKQLRPGYHKIDVMKKSTEAWKAISAEDYDVLMIDIVMPGIDGFTLAQRALQINPCVQIIFITGFAAVAMDTYNTPIYAPRPMTSKPFHLRDISQRIRFYLGEPDFPYDNFYGHQDPLAQDNVIYDRFREA